MSTLDDIKARTEKAAPGPWFVDGDGVSVYYVFFNGDTPDRDRVAEAGGVNAEFIAAARTDVPKLLAALEAVEKLAEEWRLAFREDASDTNDIWDDAARKIEQAIAEALA